MHREHGYREQGQGMHQLVGHAGMEDRQVFAAQPALEAMGGKGPQGHAGESEKCREQQKATKHWEDS
ncbi:hypothetical protein D3C85_1771880 [compost metagenome]